MMMAIVVVMMIMLAVMRLLMMMMAITSIPPHDRASAPRPPFAEALAAGRKCLSPALGSGDGLECFVGGSGCDCDKATDSARMIRADNNRSG